MPRCRLIPTLLTNHLQLGPHNSPQPLFSLNHIEIMGSGLPVEVDDLIIDLAANETATLLSCALVCRSWTTCAQRHIFTRIVLIPPVRYVDDESEEEEEARTRTGHERMAQKFHKIRTATIASPHLASYVRHLEIYIPNIQTKDRAHFTAPNVSDLSSFLKQLVNLAYLCVNFCRLGWNKVPEFHSAMHTAFKFPSLSTLVFTEADFKSSLLQECTSLRDLRLEHVDISDDKIHGIPLDSLSLHMSWSQACQLEWALQNLSGFTRHLKKISIVYDTLWPTKMVTDVEALLRANQASLESVHLNCLPSSTSRTKLSFSNSILSLSFLW